MKLPLLAILSGAALLAACSSEGEDVGASSDDVTVHPKGDTTLGTFELVVPEDLATGDHRLTVTLTPAPGSTVVETPDTSTIRTGGSIRVVPGTYCLNISSNVGGHGSRLSTSDCSIVVPGGGTRTYKLARVHFTSAPVAALLTQQGIVGRISTVQIRGDLASGEAGNDTLDLASVKARLTTSAGFSGYGPASLTDAWPPVDTEVPEGGEATLGVPTGDHIVKMGSGLEPATFPEAVRGGGMHWRWQGAPSYAKDYENTRSIDAPAFEELHFFDTDPGSIVFELGGIEKSFDIASGGASGYGYAIEVADVVDTDNAGVQTTVAGNVQIIRVSDNKTLIWTDSNGRAVVSFPTSHSVHVWGWEKYRVEVSYVKNGIAKTYKEVVDLTH